MARSFRYVYSDSASIVYASITPQISGYDKRLWGDKGWHGTVGWDTPDFLQYVDVIGMCIKQAIYTWNIWAHMCYSPYQLESVIGAAASASATEHATERNLYQNELFTPDNFVDSFVPVWFRYISHLAQIQGFHAADVLSLRDIDLRRLEIATTAAEAGRGSYEANPNLRAEQAIPMSINEDPSYFLKSHGRRVWEKLIYSSVIYPLLDTFVGGPTDTIIANINTIGGINYPTPVQEWTSINMSFIICGLALEGQTNRNIVPPRVIPKPMLKKFYTNMPIYFFVMGSYCPYCRSHVFKSHWTSYIRDKLRNIESSVHSSSPSPIDRVMYLIYHVHNSINYECQVAGLDTQDGMNVFTLYARERYSAIPSIHLLSWDDFSKHLYPRLSAGHNKLDFTI